MRKAALTLFLALSLTFAGMHACGQRALPAPAHRMLCCGLNYEIQNQTGRPNAPKKKKITLSDDTAQWARIVTTSRTPHFDRLAETAQWFIAFFDSTGHIISHAAVPADSLQFVFSASSQRSPPVSM